MKEGEREEGEEKGRYWKVKGEGGGGQTERGKWKGKD